MSAASCQTCFERGFHKVLCRNVQNFHHKTATSHRHQFDAEMKADVRSFVTDWQARPTTQMPRGLRAIECRSVGFFLSRQRVVCVREHRPALSRSLARALVWSTESARSSVYRSGQWQQSDREVGQLVCRAGQVLARRLVE
jgi:hypothetical protein